MTVDELLETAATSLRHAVEHAPMPEPPRSGPRPWRAVAATVSVAALAIVAAVFVVRAGDRHEPERPAVHTPAAGAIGDHFRLGDVPKDMVLQFVTDGYSSRSTTGVGGLFDQRFIRFDTTRTRPVGVLDILSGPNPEGKDLMTFVNGVARGLGYTVDPVEVRGQPGIRVGPLLAWNEPDGSVAMIRGPDDLNDLDELLRIADGLQPRPSGGFEPGHLPDGYEQLGELPPFSKEEAASTAQYRNQQGGKNISLFVVTDPTLPLLTLLEGPGPRETRIVDVRGHEAILVAGGTALGDRQLVWDERPGLRIEMTGKGYSTREMLRAARGLVTLTDRQWARYGAPHSTLLGSARPSDVH